MRITLSGATGFVGAALCERLAADGHHLTALARDPERARVTVPSLSRAFGWDATLKAPREALEDADAVVHLAGESVVGYWTAARRRAIRASRVDGTRRLLEALADASTRPSVLVSAGAIGFYGDRGDEELTESSAPGEGFLSETSVAWEREATAAERLGVRVVRLRIGIVLARGGGALGAMLTPARLGLGGPLGDGRQWWSWIAREDLIGIVRLALDDDTMSGAVNVTAPAAVRQADFAKTLGRVLHRPAFMPAPGWALRTMLGGFSEELLSSKRVLPAAAEACGYQFQQPHLEAALAHLL